MCSLPLHKAWSHLQNRYCREALTHSLTHSLPGSTDRSLCVTATQELLDQEEQQLILWARSVVAIDTIRRATQQADGSTRALTTSEELELAKLQDVLARERLKVEIFVAKRMAADNARLRRMVNNARRAAAMGPPPDDAPDADETLGADDEGAG